MKLYIFNPENDLALADGGFSYCPPPAAMSIAKDLASLPLWYAGKDDVVFLSNGHLQFRDTMATMFELPCAYATSMKSAVTALSPWGWSAQMRHRFFKAMRFGKGLLPSDAEIERMRNLSSRVLTIDVLTELRAAGIDTPPLPRYMNNLDNVITFVDSHDRCVVKAPWSGSGKGIMWGIGHAEEPLVHFCKGVIRRQGGVVCEHFLNVKQEFAMEFYADVAGVQSRVCGGDDQARVYLGNDDVDLKLGDQVHAHLNAAVLPRLALLRPAAHHVAYRHPRDADGSKIGMHFLCGCPPEIVVALAKEFPAGQRR